MNRDGPYEIPSGPTAYRNLLILLRPHSVNYFSFQRHGRLQHETPNRVNDNSRWYLQRSIQVEGQLRHISW